jgi:PIN domain nuclease of toxin-antitoxin system
MPTGTEGRDDMSGWSGPVLLDTCAWIWLVDGHSKMGKASCLGAVEAAAREGRLVLAPISIWEVATKAAKGRLTLSMPVGEWIHQGKQQARIADAPMSAEIAIESAALPGGGFYGDPADRMVVATARVLGAALVTSDDKIISYGAAGFVKVWVI